MIDIFLGYPVHIDHVLTPAIPDTDHTIGHMSLVTACMFFLLSSGLLLVTWQRNISRYLGLGITLAGAVMLLGYLYGAPFLYGGTIVPVAFLTTIGFSCAGIGLIFLAMPSPGLPVHAERSVQAQILEYFIPLIVGVLVIEGWILSYYLHHTDSTFVLLVAIVTFGSIGITILVSQFFSRIISEDLDEATVRRKEAEQALQESLARLKISAKIAGIGFWTWDFTSDTLIWDDRTYTIHMIPSGTPLTIYQWAEHIHP